MHRELSLLDRIERGSKAGSYAAQHTTQFNAAMQLQNVIENIQRMLNIREGSVLALPDYGMPDFNDVVKEFPDAISRMELVIGRFIETYEPRLQDLEVRYAHDDNQPLLLKFIVSGKLRANDKVSTVMFDTVLTGAGQATVRA